MKLGVLTFPNPSETATMAQMMEQLGFDSIVFADTQCLTPEVWSQMMLAASATESIEIGTGVTNPVSRDPAVTASAALGVQVASGGRVVIGIGRGDSSMAKIGRRPASPADFEQYLVQLRAYLDGREVDRAGNASRIEWLDQCDVPYVPIEVAATGPKVTDIAARCADQVCFAVGADVERLADSIGLFRKSAEAAGRDPSALKLGAYVNCVIHPDRELARESIRGGLSVFAHFSGFKGMDISKLPAYAQKSASHLRTDYEMHNHAVSTGGHAKALDEEFIHRFGIAGPMEEAKARFLELQALGLDFLRVVPGSRDMPREVMVSSMQSLAQIKRELSGASNSEAVSA